MKQTPTLRLRLRPAAESIVRSGHPWVFADSVKSQNREGAAGELAVVFDRNDKFMAVGLYDPKSPIRVRILHCGKPVKVDAAFWKSRFEQALAKRNFGPETTAYRCIHGENDGFPGLVLDRYADTHVVKIYTAPWLSHLQEVIPLIQAPRLILRHSKNIESFVQNSNFSQPVLRGEPPTSTVQFLENGLRFEADVLRGQKTGFFLDQRENRQVVETLAAGRDVLNAFSFSGAFSVYAARGRAASVTDLDISPHALQSARRNIALNQLPTPHHAIQADTFEYLAGKPARKYGLIILDPPSLAKREADKAGALRAYRQLAQSAVPWLARDGILIAASCSAHVAPDEFFQAIKQAVPTFREFKRTENPVDHPAVFPEARYLKCLYLAAPG